MGSYSDDMFDRLADLPALRSVISDYNLRAKKSLGQNFLLDQNITDKIVRHAGDLSGFTVFEIGPGPGGLTRSILRGCPQHVIAIEYDERAVEALQGLKSVVDGRLEIVQSDALTVDLTALSGPPRAIVANLPYNIATPLLIGWLKHIYDDPAAFSSMTLMFQKEVAQRITASPGDKLYGRLSVLCQFLCSARRVYDLPPSAFTPPPKVTSSVVHFVPKNAAELSQKRPAFKAVEKLTAAAFGQRRKMIRSSLKAYLPHIEALGIDPTKRAEELSVDDFINLAFLA